jgi:hypothetical protein
LNGYKRFTRRTGSRNNPISETSKSRFRSSNATVKKYVPPATQLRRYRDIRLPPSIFFASTVRRIRVAIRQNKPTTTNQPAILRKISDTVDCFANPPYRAAPLVSNFKKYV